MTSEASDPTACSARPDTRSVLVVEDDPDILLVLDIALEDYSAGGGRDVVIPGAHGTWRTNPASTGSAPVTPAR